MSAAPAYLVVFDWNGTLLADTRVSCTAVNHILKHLGKEPVTLERFRETAAIPAFDFYAQNGCTYAELESTREECAAIFHKVYEEGAAGCRSRRGSRRILHWINSMGGASLLLSNHTMTGIEAQLARLGFTQYITAVLAHTDLGIASHKRTKQTRLENFLKARNWQNIPMILVGDGPEEMEIAKTLGAYSAAVTGGNYSEKRLRRLNPDFVIHSITELQAILEEIWTNAQLKAAAV